MICISIPGEFQSGHLGYATSVHSHYYHDSFHNARSRVSEFAHACGRKLPDRRLALDRDVILLRRQSKRLLRVRLTRAVHRASKYAIVSAISVDGALVGYVRQMVKQEQCSRRVFAVRLDVVGLFKRGTNDGQQIPGFFFFQSIDADELTD